MDKWKRMIPYLAVLAVDFYLLPALIRDTGSGMVIDVYKRQQRCKPRIGLLHTDSIKHWLKTAPVFIHNLFYYII